MWQRQDAPLLVLAGDNPGDVFLEFVVVSRVDEVLPPSHREHDVKLNLSIGVGHPQDAAPKGAWKCYFG
jgi:hypothetical protein